MADNNQVMEATESFCTEVDGQRVMVTRGQTRVAGSHVLAQRFAHYFRPVRASYGVEEATDEPGVNRQRVVAAEAHSAPAPTPEAKPAPEAAERPPVAARPKTSDARASGTKQPSKED